MSYLLRVSLPDVPGSLGRLAAAIGDAGGNIDAIEIVERLDGRAVDDVFLNSLGSALPDSIIASCNAVEGVEVLWISRYPSGSNLTRDLEAVEVMTSSPDDPVTTLLHQLPKVLVVDWALKVGQNGAGIKVLDGSSAAPETLPDDFVWPVDFEVNSRVDVPEPWTDYVIAAAPLCDTELLVIARRGGPEILDSEVARLSHLAALAVSISTSRTKPTPTRQ